jgi:hypothetical protein
LKAFNKICCLLAKAKNNINCLVLYLKTTFIWRFFGKRGAIERINLIDHHGRSMTCLLVFVKAIRWTRTLYAQNNSADTIQRLYYSQLPNIPLHLWFGYKHGATLIGAVALFHLSAFVVCLFYLKVSAFSSSRRRRQLVSVVRITIRRRRKRDRK